MKAQNVVVKDFKGASLNRVACGMEHGKVLITSRKGLLRMKNGEPIHPIHFPMSAVYCDEADVPEYPDWSKLKPWQA